MKNSMLIVGVSLGLLASGCGSDRSRPQAGTVVAAARAETIPLISIAPDHGPPGTVVSVVIERELEGLVEIEWEGRRFPVDASSAQELRFTVPADVESGYLRVASGGEVSRRLFFSVGTYSMAPVSSEAVSTDPSGTTFANDQLLLLGEVGGLTRERVDELAIALGGSVSGEISEYGMFQVQLGRSHTLAELRDIAAGLEVSGLSYAGANVALELLQDASVGETDVDLLPESDQANWDSVGLRAAWDRVNEALDTRTIDLEPVTVGVIEDGIDTRHPELRPYFDSAPDLAATRGLQVIYNPPPLAGGQARRITHGTAVTSVLVGAHNGEGANGVLNGVAQDRISVFARTFASFGALDPAILTPQAGDAVARPRSGATFVSETAAAIRFTQSIPQVRVINMSWGAARAGSMSALGVRRDQLTPLNTVAGDAEFELLRQVYRRVIGAHPGILFVAAAGNHPIPVEDVVPSGLDLPNLISVGSYGQGRDRFLNRSQGVSTRSGYGPGVELYAPGEAVLLPFRGSFARANGTSFATPFVSGAAALLAAIDPSLRPAQLRRILVATATELSAAQSAVPLWNSPQDAAARREPAGFVAQGARLLNVFAAVDRVLARLESPQGTPERVEVNGLTPVALGPSGGSLTLDLSLTDLLGEAIPAQLRPEDVRFEDLELELVDPSQVSNPPVVDTIELVADTVEAQVDGNEGVTLALLMDQSRSVSDVDPDQLRVRGAETLVDQVLDANPLSRAGLWAIGDPRQTVIIGQGSTAIPDIEGSGRRRRRGFSLQILYALINPEEFTRDRPALTEALDLLRRNAGGGISTIYLNMDRVLESLAASDEGGSRVLVVFSDGSQGLIDDFFGPGSIFGPTSGPSPETVIQDARAANVRVFAVGLGGGEARGLRRIAAATGGAFVNADEASQLTERFEQLGRGLTNSLRVGATLNLSANPGLAPNQRYRLAGTVIVTDPVSGREFRAPFEEVFFLNNL
jgi:hypothetical protein